MRVNRPAAARSIITWASLWVCRNVAGMASLIEPSTHFWMMAAFSSPHAVRKIWRAFRMVEIPMVTAQGGTVSLVDWLIDISSRVRLSIRMRRELEVRLEPGSLMAMLPMRPMPSSMMSMPPKLWMRCS